VDRQAILGGSAPGESYLQDPAPFVRENIGRHTLIVLGRTALVAALAGISYGVVANHVTAKNLTKVVEDTSDQVGLAIKDMQRSLSSLACMVMDHHLALDFLLAKQGGYVPLPIPLVAHM
jgi:hypothetical protein